MPAIVPVYSRPPNGQYLASIAGEHLCVHSARTKLFLGSYALVVDGDHELAEPLAVWKSSSSHIAVLTRDVLTVLSLSATSKPASVAAQDIAPRLVDICLHWFFFSPRCDVVIPVQETLYSFVRITVSRNSIGEGKQAGNLLK